MSTLRVHRVRDKEVVKVYRLIPYGELAEVLREDGVAFLEDGARELKRGTVWRAARRLSEIVGKKVRVERAVLRFEDGTCIEGWNFFVQEEREE